MLKHGDRIQGIEDAVAEWQTAGIGSRELDSQIMGGRFLTRGEDFGENEIDTKEPDLRDVELTYCDLGQPLASTDIENAVSGSRLQRLRQKLRELVIPPRLTQVLERG